MSLNDLAVDLTCEPKEIALHPSAQADPLPFVGEDPYRTNHPFIDVEDILESIPGSYPGFLDNTTSELPPSGSQFSLSGDNYQVHGGIHKMAMEMGSIGRPVWLVVQDALKRNPSYDLVLCGHSLGAGLCTMLGLVELSFPRVDAMNNILSPLDVDRSEKLPHYPARWSAARSRGSGLRVCSPVWALRGSLYLSLNDDFLDVFWTRGYRGFLRRLCIPSSTRMTLFLVCRLALSVI
jgi:hypothetical protein